MSVRKLIRLGLAGLAAALLLAPLSPARAQEPSSTALAAASDILDIKGSMTIFEPLIPGVVEQSKNTLLQINPNYFKDLNDISAMLRKEYAPRLAALRTEIVKAYAVRFTEQELKDTLAFYRSPLGKKLLAEEAQFVDKAMSTAQDWAMKLNEEALARFRAEMKKRGHAL
jgi:hypothetical protein